MLEHKNNTKEELIELLENKLLIHEDYENPLEQLENMRENLYDKQTEEYFNCLKAIEKLEEEKKIKEIKNKKKCKHNLFYIKKIEQLEDTYIITAECLCCSEKIIENNHIILKEWYDNCKLICGYNNELNLIVEPKHYLGSKANEIIESKYLEICSQILELEEAFIDMGYEKYKYLIKTPEEVMAEYYRNLFKMMENERINSIKQFPTYIKKKTKKEYL